MIELELETPKSAGRIAVLIDIVSVNVPALLGLNVLDGERLYADNFTNCLVNG